MLIPKPYCQRCNVNTPSVFLVVAFHPFRALGIQTLLVGLAFWDSLSFSTSFSLWAGFRDFTPSIPAVFFPWLSCVTRANGWTFSCPRPHQGLL